MVSRLEAARKYYRQRLVTLAFFEWHAISKSSNWERGGSLVTPPISPIKPRRYFAIPITTPPTSPIKSSKNTSAINTSQNISGISNLSYISTVSNNNNTLNLSYNTNTTSNTSNVNNSKLRLLKRGTSPSFSELRRMRQPIPQMGTTC